MIYVIVQILTLHNVSHDEPSILLNDLEPYTTYNITVQAFVLGSPYAPVPRSLNIRTLEAGKILDFLSDRLFKGHTCRRLNAKLW